MNILKSSKGSISIVDYAHTPNVENVLTTINKIRGDNKIISIIGAGGDRDKSKRQKWEEWQKSIAIM